MKIVKGEAGYLRSQKKIEIIKAAVSFGLVFAILITGIVTTGNRLNWMTIIAVLGCLPASKVLVGVITRMPYKSIDKKMADEIAGKTTYLTTVYDMIITSREKIMPVECMVISDHTVCGYASSKKVDVQYAADYIKQMLNQNKIDHVTVKLFDGYTKFITRAEGMNNMAAIDEPESKEREELIRQLILSISM
ncbi:hypothetical protein [Hespellia stercorisuis]|uniref:Uncharacterized protein n=1 Tax=Hespellia stercorisuis DSM 15480 TaxID=1121950 RepID=A0A1M6S3S7_9FIRM|nr:hypothetical protein [Hespellia stercorisuis]SHK39117.1 hypothetical protein SAMN02745243_02835 [Hespellia stercorisuis DSM 15480]